MSRKFSFYVLLASIAVIGVLFYRVMANFILPLFLAVLLVVMFHPLHRWILERCKQRQGLAALLTTAAVMLIVLVPTGIVLTLAAQEGASLVGKFNPATAKGRLAKLRTRLGLEMSHAEPLRNIEATLAGLLEKTKSGASAEVQRAALQSVRRELDKIAGDKPAADELTAALDSVQQTEPGSLENQAAVQQALAEFQGFKVTLLGGTPMAQLTELANPSDQRLGELSDQTLAMIQSGLPALTADTAVFAGRMILGMAIMIVAVYFFFVDGPKMVAALMRLSPLDDRYEKELLDEFDRISRAVVLATLLAAVAQGVLAGIGFWFAGLGSVFLLMLLTTVFAMIPFVGAAAVWVPASLWLYFYEERTLAAVLLAIYGVSVISLADNVVKPLVLHGQSNLHPLLALLSVLGGVQALGPIGILVGPMAVAFLQTLLNILHRELTAQEKAETEST
jgi:predicted PurR-regulated permease PerM